jgi:hypothetical protein
VFADNLDRTGAVGALGLFIQRFVGLVHLACQDGGNGIAPAQEIPALAPDRFHIDGDSLFGCKKLRRTLQDVGIESPCQSLIPGDDNEQSILLFSLSEQQVTWLSGLRIVDFGARHQRLKHVGQHLGVRPRCQRAFLRLAQLGRRDRLHGLGDLPRVDHTANAAPDVENVCHCQSSATSNQKPETISLLPSPSRQQTSACIP